MKVDVILGLQWGDEGKGKIVDALGPQYDIIARFQGGPNAGHTLEFDGQKHVLHTIPSGIFHTQIVNLIGNGVLLDPYIFRREIRLLQEKGLDPTLNLKISQKTHLILPSHRLLDAALEQRKGKAKIGSTLKGIGPAYTDKTARHGLRVGDILEGDFLVRYEALRDEHFRQMQSLNLNPLEQKIENLDFNVYEQEWMLALEELKKFDIIAAEYYLNQALNQGKKVLAEGAQGTLLDIDFGSYPFVTSSNTTTAGVCTGLGLAPSRIGRVFGIFKAYCTRVGSGPFPTELLDATGEELRKQGHEFGSTTGRPRRCGWLDIPALKYAIMINGVTDLIVTKIDVLNPFETFSLCHQYQVDNTLTDHFQSHDLKGTTQCLLTPFPGWKQSLDACKTYTDLPDTTRQYIEHIEKATNLPVSIVSIGPDRTQTLYR